MKIESYFNSIKVQLEPANNLILCHVLTFQFHKGTIRTHHIVCYEPLHRNFNSIKVQLERVKTANQLATYPVFQFHKGTIRTRSMVTTQSAGSDFNSIKVQLERYANRIYSTNI